MKELWKKYTRTQEQRAMFAILLVVVSAAIVLLIISPPLFLAVAAVVGAFIGVALFIWIIGTWIDNGERY